MTDPLITQLDRVIVAIHSADDCAPYPGGKPWLSDDWERYERMARAAIEAVRPSEDVVEQVVSIGDRLIGGSLDARKGSLAQQIAREAADAGLLRTPVDQEPLTAKSLNLPTSFPEPKFTSLFRDDPDLSQRAKDIARGRDHDAIRDEAFARTLNDHAEALERLRRYDEGEPPKLADGGRVEDR